MKIGLAMSRTPDAPGIKEFVKRAEDLGFESVLIGDHVVLPTAGTTQYPYTADGSFIRPADEPFLDAMALLGFMTACSDTIRLGTTVIIVPYRDPVVQAKMFSSLDVLSGGRIICGVGVGWLEKEFETLNVPYAERGPMTDEYIEVFQTLWTQEDPVYNGRFVKIDGIKFTPKPVQSPLPIWVGGHTRRALRRTAKYGHCWHPTRQTPDFVAKNLPYLWEQTELAGRDPNEITISLKRSLHFTDIGLGEQGTVRSGGAMIGDTAQVIDDIRYCGELGIDQLTYDFRVSSMEDNIRVMEHLAETALPVAESLD